ncbi:Esterase E4, partial [Gryllus bimaculatus]
GRARGAEATTYLGRRVRAWRGLPYAAPPVGALRFRPPAPPPSWNGTRDAAAEGAACPQMVLLSRQYEGREDCLFLNVYAPYDAKGLPVLAWHHGGAFVEGHGGARWGGPEYIMEQPLVFVTFNYRLGPLGFLSTGDSAAQGNYGLKDAAAAMKWVRANIASFGGDPRRVALWGYSAGAASVHLLTLAPPARGLFDAAIYGSGSGLHRWALFADPLPTARRLAALVNCSDALPTTDLVAFPSLVGDMPMPWGPVVEGDPAPGDPPFLPAPPAQLVAQGRVAPVPVVTGMTTDEAVDAAYPVHTNAYLADRLDLHLLDVLREYAPVPNISVEAAAESLVSTPHDINFPPATKSISGLKVFIGLKYSLHVLNSSAPVYFYRFALDGRVSELVRAGLAGEPHGVMHADDLLYAVGRQYPPALAPADWPNATEALAIQRLTRLWYNVAAHGAPAPDGAGDALLGAAWAPLGGASAKDFRFLDFDAQLRPVEGPPFADRIALWQRLAQFEAIEDFVMRKPTAPHRCSDLDERCSFGLEIVKNPLRLLHFCNEASDNESCE